MPIGTPAPPWVQAALSWGREMAAFCELAETVQDYSDGNRDEPLERVASDLLNATSKAQAAADAWRAAGAAPMDVANAIAALNQITRRTLVPVAGEVGSEDALAFDKTAKAWLIGAVEICNRMESVEILVKSHLETLLGGVADSFKAGVAKAFISARIKRAAGFVILTVLFGAALLILSRRDP